MAVVPENIIGIVSSLIFVLDLLDARGPSPVTSMALIPPGQSRVITSAPVSVTCVLLTDCEASLVTYLLNSLRMQTFKEN